MLLVKGRKERVRSRPGRPFKPGTWLSKCRHGESPRVVRLVTVKPSCRVAGAPFQAVGRNRSQDFVLRLRTGWERVRCSSLVKGRTGIAHGEGLSTLVSWLGTWSRRATEG